MCLGEGVILTLYMGRCSSSFKVVAYRLDGSLFRVYDSANQASKNRHTKSRAIDKCIKGEIDTAFGYMWRRYLVSEIPESIEPLRKEILTYTRIPILEVDEKGDIIHFYSSIKKASEELGIDSRSIRDVLKGKLKTCNGHMFRYLNSEELEKYNIVIKHKIINRNKIIIQLSLDGRYIKQYSSIKKAAESIGRNPRGISNVLNGAYKTAYGYRWRYK